MITSMKRHPSIRTIEQVLKADLCLGCGACQHVVPNKLRVEMSQEGYLRPVVLAPLTDAENDIATAVCPGIHVEHDPPLPTGELMWGPVKSCNAGWSTDPALRHKASSGGGISALAGHLLRSGMVDAVLHIGVSEADPLGNVYRISTTPEQVAANAGSRYAPAAPLLGLQTALDQHATIAVIGKPCDIVAVRKLADVDPRVKEKVRYCLSFMCPGVQSIKGTHAVIKALNTKVEDVAEFRYRGNGWSGLATADTHDRQSSSMTYDDSWGKILNNYLQFRCKVCFDGTGEFANSTCADAWHSDKNGYRALSETAGRSIILARTNAGQRLLRSADNWSEIHHEPLDEVHPPALQTHQRDRKNYALAHMLALNSKQIAKPLYNFGSMGSLAILANPYKLGRNFMPPFKTSAKRSNGA